MVGFTQSQIPDTNGILPPPVPKEDTITVTKFNDITLLINGYHLTYQSISPDYYSYEWFSSISQNYAVISFKKVLEDSAFYEAGVGNNIIYLKGKKIQKKLSKLRKHHLLLSKHRKENRFCVLHDTNALQFLTGKKTQ